MRPVALVVMEPGCDWPSWIVRQDVDVVAVRDREDAGEDALRALRQRIERIPRPLSAAVLACSLEADDWAIQRRIAIARVLLSAIADSERGQLTISASANASSALRHELIGLTATLSEYLAGSKACVSLRFGGVARPIQGLMFQPAEVPRFGPTTTAHRRGRDRLLARIA